MALSGFPAGLFFVFIFVYILISILLINFIGKSFQLRWQDIGRLGHEEFGRQCMGEASSWCHQPRKLPPACCCYYPCCCLHWLLCLPQAGLPLPPLPPPLHPLLPHHPLHLSAPRTPRPPPLLLPASATLKTLQTEDKTASSVVAAQPLPVAPGSPLSRPFEKNAQSQQSAATSSICEKKTVTEKDNFKINNTFPLLKNRNLTFGEKASGHLKNSPCIR